MIKTLLFGTAFSNVIGRAWSAPVLFQVRPVQAAAAGKESGFMRMRLSDFPELAQPRGSVRISTSALDSRTNKQTGLFAPVIINRDDDGEFHVMSAACTHEECVVRRLSTASNRMVCPCHGSQYLADGSVVQGPAQQDLLRYDFTQEDDVLTIFLPSVFYEIAVEKAPNTSRLQLSFIAFESLQYEVYFRETLDSTPERVSFALSPDGPLDQIEIEVPGDFARVYVERPGRFGFFEIALKTRKV